MWLYITARSATIFSEGLVIIQTCLCILAHTHFGPISKCNLLCFLFCASAHLHASTHPSIWQCCGPLWIIPNCVHLHCVVTWNMRFFLYCCWAHVHNSNHPDAISSATTFRRLACTSLFSCLAQHSFLHHRAYCAITPMVTESTYNVSLDQLLLACGQWHVFLP